MTNIEKVNKAFQNANEETKKEVLKLLGVKEDSKFIPEKGDEYYVITEYGIIDLYTWANDKYDNHYLLMNNVYRTKEEAEQASDVRTRKAKLIKEIEDSSDVIDWNDGTHYKYHILLDERYNSLRLGSNVYAQAQGTNYTTNKQFLYELIEERSDEVKELLFDIK